MKSKRILRNIIFIIMIIIALAVSLNIERPLTNIEKTLKELLLPVNKVLSLSKRGCQSTSDSYLIQKNINASLEHEIKELKALLNLKSTHSEYSQEHAKVISRNNIYWLNTITIDKGANDGIQPDFAVITPSGLIGKITKITPNYSEVKLITSNDIAYKTSVIIRINQQDHYAVLNGYDEETGLLKVTAIDKNIQTEANDTVLTSGLGNMPRGIYIGKIVSSEIDNYDLSKTLYVKPEQDFNSINYVTVLKEKTQ